MKNHFSERWILPMEVSFPIGCRQIELDISRQSLDPVDSDQRMYKIRTGFLVPEAKLENLDRRTVGRPEGRTERTRIPKRLILKFGPGVAKIIGRLSDPLVFERFPIDRVQIHLETELYYVIITVKAFDGLCRTRPRPHLVKSMEYPPVGGRVGTFTGAASGAPSGQRISRDVILGPFAGVASDAPPSARDRPAESLRPVCKKVRMSGEKNSNPAG